MKKKSMILSALLAASLLCFGGNADVSAASAHHDEAEHVHATHATASVDGGWTVTEGRTKLDKHAKSVCFLARLTPVVPDATPYWGLVYAYEDLQGNVKLTSVKDLPLGE